MPCLLIGTLTVMFGILVRQLSNRVIIKILEVGKLYSCYVNKGFSGQKKPLCVNFIVMKEEACDSVETTWMRLKLGSRDNCSKTAQASYHYKKGWNSRGYCGTSDAGLNCKTKSEL